MAVPLPKLKVPWQFTCQNSESDGNSLAKNLSTLASARSGWASQTQDKTKGIQRYQLQPYFNQYLQWFTLTAVDHTTTGWFPDPRKIILMAGPLLTYQSLAKNTRIAVTFTVQSLNGSVRRNPTPL